MGQKVSKQVQNSDKNTEIKRLGDDKLFIPYIDCLFLEFSLISKPIVYDLGKNSFDYIFSIAKTPDNKSQFVSSPNHNFREINIPSLREVYKLPNIGERICVVTYDNKILVTAYRYKLTKLSIRTKQRLHTWPNSANMHVYSQSVSQDNKYQLIGSNQWLGIFDLQKNQTLEHIQVMSDPIFSVAFSRDNQTVFISDKSGYIKMIKWQASANSGDDFDFNEKPIKVGMFDTYSICLTKDEKYLLVGGCERVCIFAITKLRLSKPYKSKNVVRTLSQNGLSEKAMFRQLQPYYGVFVRTITLAGDGKTAIIVENNGGLCTLNLETFEIKKIAKDKKKVKRLYNVIVI